MAFYNSLSGPTRPLHFISQICKEDIAWMIMILITSWVFRTVNPISFPLFIRHFSFYSTFVSYKVNWVTCCDTFIEHVICWNIEYQILFQSFGNNNSQTKLMYICYETIFFFTHIKYLSSTHYLQEHKVLEYQQYDPSVTISLPNVCFSHQSQQKLFKDKSLYSTVPPNYLIYGIYLF